MAGKLTPISVALLITLITVQDGATADPIENFYHGKTLEFYIGTDAGPGAVTAYPRLIAEVLGSHVPGKPTVVIRYMPGGAGIKAGNFLYNLAPQDGTVIGFVSRGFILAPLLSSQAIFDPTKFNWVGSPTSETSVGVIWTAGTDVRTAQEAMQREVIVGGTAASNDTGLFPLILNEFAGTKFKSVLGYKSAATVEFAMERGEVQGKIGWTWGSLNSARTADWFDTGKVTVLMQLGLKKSPKIPSRIPLALDLAKTAEGRQVMSLVFSPADIGNPAFMGPGVPAERVNAIRIAYLQTMTDPRFLQLLRQQNLPVDPLDGAEIKKVVDEIYALPPNVVRRTRELLPPS